jgi:hypothetical protein
MATVIDALEIVQKNKKLPCEAFFVDTNIIVYYKDLFGESLTNVSIQPIVNDVSGTFPILKSKYKSYCTLSVAIEFYKHIQINFYQKFLNKRFDTEDFKKQRESNIAFFDGWDLQIKQFKKVFRKEIEVHLEALPEADIIESFEGSKVDFGDHAIYKTLMRCEKNLRCVFTHDSDFYSYQNDFYLLTCNPSIIREARKDGKLFH